MFLYMDISMTFNTNTGPKGMEPAAGTFTDTRDSRPLQEGIKDLS